MLIRKITPSCVYIKNCEKKEEKNILKLTALLCFAVCKTKKNERERELLSIKLSKSQLFERGSIPFDDVKNRGEEKKKREKEREKSFIHG